MLRFISWSVFLITLLVTMFVYWLVVLLVYYKRDLITFFKKTAKIQPAEGQASSKDIDRYEECNDCAAIVKSVIRQIGLAKSDKNSLISDIKRSLITYSHFKGTIWQTPINNLIKYESKQSCSMTIEEKDLEIVWESTSSILP